MEEVIMFQVAEGDTQKLRHPDIYVHMFQYYVHCQSMESYQLLKLEG